MEALKEAKARIAELEAGLHKKTQEFRHLLKAGFAEMEAARAIQAREDWHVRAELLDLANVCIRRVLEIDAASKTKPQQTPRHGRRGKNGE